MSPQNIPSVVNLVMIPDPVPMSADPVPACRGECESEFVSLIVALEDCARSRGFALLYFGARHLSCGQIRASATNARRRMADLLRRRARILAGKDSDGS